MDLSRTSIGLALRAAREAAGLSLRQLSTHTAIPLSTLSKSEAGIRDTTYAEVLRIISALKVTGEHFRTLAETFERPNVLARVNAMKAEKDSQKLARHAIAVQLNEIQRLAIEAAIELEARPKTTALN